MRLLDRLGRGLLYLGESLACSVGLVWLVFRASEAIPAVGQNRVVNVAVSEPYFIAQICAAAALGLATNRLFFHRLACWVWVLPAVWLLYFVTAWPHWGQASWWADVWNNFFGKDCGASECLNEWYCTAPFYASVAYSAGAWVASLTRARNKRA